MIQRQTKLNCFGDNGINGVTIKQDNDKGVAVKKNYRKWGDYFMN